MRDLVLLFVEGWLDGYVIIVIDIVIDIAIITI